MQNPYTIKYHQNRQQDDGGWSTEEDERLSANKRQIRPTKFQDFTAKNITDWQAAFLIPHSNTEQHKNSLLVRDTIDWNHLIDDQMKAPNAWGLQTTDRHPKHQLTHMRALISRRT